MGVGVEGAKPSPEKSRVGLYVTAVGIAVAIIVILIGLWTSGALSGLTGAPQVRPVQILNYDCYANPVFVGLVAHWEGDLRNPGTAAASATLDFLVDGAAVRTRTYQIPAGETFHFVEDFQRAGQDTGSHTCDVRLR